MSKNFLSEHFTVEEFDCHCGCGSVRKDPSLISPLLLQDLESLRLALGRPILINSGYRCKEMNKQIPRASLDSLHCVGKAADIRVNGVRPIEVFYYAVRVGFRGLGLYKNFVHVDVRDKLALWVSL